MKIAPIDIAHRNFSRKMMGLDATEVGDFLKAVADEMEALMRERNQLRETLRDKELAIIEYKERDELLKNTITTATRMSDKIQTDAEREAKLILADAQQKGDMIIADARESLKKMYAEITELKKIRMQFENNVRALVQSHMSLLEQGHRIMPNPNIEGSLAHSGPGQAAPVGAQMPSAKAKPNEDVIRSNVNAAVEKAARDIGF